MLRKWATPLMISTSIVVTITGIMLFFHFGGRVSHVAHEWIGWLMAFAIVAHIALNWKSFKIYWKKPLALVIIGLGIALTLLSFAPDGGEREGGDPRRAMMQIMHGLEDAPIASLAQASGKSEQDVETIFSEAGYAVSGDQSINDVIGGDREGKMQILSQIFDGGHEH